ncbi:phytoene/squalene synthase family protein [Lysobacter brunescens]|uniref:Phytoene/squalene synthase family protein n=1 Tax=Lysobacter brunescens TaxID=262323 RepID=A0ABW2YK88_9GAMM
MTDTTDLDDFLDKWRGRWPEWRIAQVFVPEPQRPLVEAWFALLQEWTDAAWAGEDPTPGTAKLGWWQEELRGWSKGLRRHPLGRLLQKQPAPWPALAEALAALASVREPLRAWASPNDARAALKPFADAIAACEAVLFAGQAGQGDAFSILAAHALWHREDDGTAGRAREWAGALAAQPATRAGTRPRRIHDALTAGRLRRLARLGDITALPPLAALWRSWRAA